MMSVCLFSVCLFSLNFRILLQHNIRPPSRDCSPCTIEFAASVNLKTHFDLNCNVCATEFVAGVNLKRHDTSTQTVMNVMNIFIES